MIVRCGLLKKSDVFETQDAFFDHWVNIHGPIAAEMDYLREYKQNLVIDKVNERFPSGKIDIDGFSELHFDNYGEMLAGVKSLNGETGNALLDDAEYFSQKRLCDVVVFFRKVVREVPAYLWNTDLIHMVSFISRPDDMTPARFEREWCDVHAKLVETIPGFIGYNQNVVLDRYVDGLSATPEQLPCDGMADLYFEDQAALDCFNDSWEREMVKSGRGSALIGAIDTYFVKSATIVSGADLGGYPL